MFWVLLLVLQVSSAEHYPNHDRLTNQRKILFQAHTLDTTTATNVHGRQPWSFSSLRASLSSTPLSAAQHHKTQAEDLDEQHPFANQRTWLLHIDPQFPINRTLRGDVEAALGVPLGAYYPHHTFGIVGSADLARKAQELRQVAWVGKLPNVAKLTGPLVDFWNEASAEALMDEKRKPQSSLLKMQSVLLDVQLSARVVPQPRSVEEAQQIAEGWLSDLDLPGEATAKAKNGERVFVNLEAHGAMLECLTALLESIISHPATVAVEHSELPTVSNREGRDIMQGSGGGGSWNIYDQGLRGDGQIIGVADSGLDFDHCMFVEQGGFVHDFQREPENPDGRKLLHYHVLPGADMKDQEVGHGTHVCGSIAGDDPTGATNSGGADLGQFGGMAPGAKLIFHDVGKGDALSGLNSVDLGNDIFDVAWRGGARIHSNSWGSSTPTYTQHARSIDDFVRKHPEFLVLVAAGNDGVKDGQITGTVGSPATMKNGLAIGASQVSIKGWTASFAMTDWEGRRKDAEDQLGSSVPDCCSHSNPKVKAYCCEQFNKDQVSDNSKRYGEEAMADFSSRGPTADGRVKPELVAPGQFILSARGDGETKYMGTTSQQCTDRNPNLASMAGTSMATPLSAGGAALVREYFLSGFHPSGERNANDELEPSAALLKAVMVNGAHTLTGEIDLHNDDKEWVPLGEPGIWPIKQIFQGWGRVDLASSLLFKNRGDQKKMFIQDNKAVDTDEDHDYCFVMPNRGTLKATLVWADFPGEINSEMVSVNNLDLIMGTSDGEPVAGNFVTKRDEKNNIENAFYTAEAGQEVFVKVRGFHVPQGSQSYSLVVSGPWSSARDTCTEQFTVDKNHFDPAGDAEYFPYGAVVGGAVGVTLLGLIIAFVQRKLRARVGAGD